MNLTNDSSAKKISSAELNKIRQKKKILGLMRTTGYVSAPSLSKWLKISLPTCILLLNDLMAAGYVKNFGIGESSGGRKPSLYGLPEDRFYVISCDLLRFSASIAIIDSYHNFVTPVIEVNIHKSMIHSWLINYMRLHTSLWLITIFLMKKSLVSV